MRNHICKNNLINQNNDLNYVVN